MRRLLLALTITGLLGAVPGLAADLWNDDGYTDSDDRFWSSDNWQADDYGSFDSDFDWDTGDAGFDGWYSDSADDWDDVNEYDAQFGLYDVDEDEGWFDI